MGSSVRLLAVLGAPRPDRATWAVDADDLGELVVKARRGGWAAEKTRWCAEHLPLLARRGYPAPEIVWHGAVPRDWYVVAQRRLPGAPLRRLDAPLLRRLLELVELQADAGVDPEPRDFAAYQAYVLFEGWDHVWRDAEAVTRPVCDRLRRWLEPVWGLRLPARDFANNDLNLTNVLGDGTAITGVVDWDEFGLNSRAADLAALAFDCERLGDDALVDVLVRRIAEIAGEDGLRCLVAYRVIAVIGALARRGERDGAAESSRAAARLLDRLEA